MPRPHAYLFAPVAGRCLQTQFGGVLDRMDGDAVVEIHADAVVCSAGPSASLQPDRFAKQGIQGTSVIDMSPEWFSLPMDAYPMANFFDRQGGCATQRSGSHIMHLGP